MIGGFGLHPILVTVDTGVIDARIAAVVGGVADNNFSSRLIVNGEGGADDDIDQILSEKLPGMMMVVQGIVGQTLTFKNLAKGGSDEDIRTPNGGDFKLVGEQNVTLIYDAVNNEWSFMDGAFASAIIPSGTVENEHIEWDNILNAWVAVQAETHGATGPFADSGFHRFANNQIMLSIRNFLDDGNLEVKGDAGNAFNITNSKNGPVLFKLRALDAVDPDQIFSITQFAGASGRTAYSTPDLHEFNIGVTKILTIDTNVIITQKNFRPDSALDGLLDTGSVGARWRDVWASGLKFQTDTDIVMSITGITFRAGNVTTDNMTFILNGTQRFQMTDVLNLFSGINEFQNVIDIGEITTPANPGTNKGRVYTKDVGTHAELFYRDELGTETNLIAGGTPDKISEGDSFVEVIDAGTGVIDIQLDGSVRVNFTATRMGFNVDGTYDIGTNTSRPDVVYVDNLDLQDDLASHNPSGGATRIVGDQGGMGLGVAAGDDDFDFFFGGVSEFKILEDGEINFNSVGKRHKIIPQGTSLDINTENQSDNILLKTGGGRTNENLLIGDTDAIFKTENDQIGQYRLVIRQEHNTPAAARPIGNLIWSAENTSSINVDYVTQEGESSVVTGGSEQGRWRVGVMVNGSVGVVGIELIGVSTALRMGIFGVTPVVRQSVASDTLANLYTALRNYGWIV